MKNKNKIRKLYLIIGILFLGIFGFLIFLYSQFDPVEKSELGINFSSRHVTYLGMDWKKIYSDVFTDLKPKYLRLPIYWDDVERQRGVFDFSDLDYQLQIASQNDAKVILVVGKKQPRWPECHVPVWVKSLSGEEQKNLLKNYIVESVRHFKSYASVEFWQVENEPIFGFGPDCPKINTEQLSEEIGWVRGEDNRKIIVTDSGELGRWIPTAKSGADYFGTTMYRVVHNPKIGYYSYHLPPLFFRLKAGMLNAFVGQTNIYGVELQAEPWFATDVLLTPIPRQKELMNAEMLSDNISYARKSGFERHYLWGVEWWYWMNEKNNDSSLLETAKHEFNN